MNFLNNKTKASYVGLVFPVLAIALVIFGSVTYGLVGDTFSSLIVTFLILGAIASILGFVFGKIEIIGIIAIIFYGLALGFIFKDGIEVLVYANIGIDNNVGGKGGLTLAYLIMGAILVIGSVVMTFLKTEKN